MARRPAKMSPEARSWYLARLEYIAERNPVAARKFQAMIMKARRHLADFSRIGQTGLIPGTRRLVVGPYILTVRRRDGAVEIGAIRHARQGDAYEPKELLEEGMDQDDTEDLSEDDTSEWRM